MLLGSFLPIIIYLLYGREPKIDYRADYEKDLPTDDPPAIVNAICSGGSKKVGLPDIGGFKATIMDLIDKKYLIFQDVPADVENLRSDDSIFLAINPDKDTTSLWEFETTILDFLGEYEQEFGIISTDLISKSLSYYNGAFF